MAKAPGFIFYPGDYLRDTQCLSEKVQVSYDRIMCEHMRNICISHQQLKFFIKRLNAEEVDELMQVLTETSGGFQIAWVSDSILKYKSFCNSRSENRKGKTKKQVNNTSSTSEQLVESESDCINSKDIKDIEGIEDYILSSPKSRKNFLPVFEKMMQVFENRFSGYFKDLDKDFPACETIAQKTEKLKAWPPGSVLNGHLDEFLIFWAEVVEYVVGDDWLSGRSLFDLSTKEWQRLGQHMNKKSLPEKQKKSTEGLSDYQKEMEDKRAKARNKKME